MTFCFEAVVVVGPTEPVSCAIADPQSASEIVNAVTNILAGFAST